MWLKLMLAALGVGYDVLKCVLCNVLYLKKKGDINPPGWLVEGATFLCPDCAKGQATKNPEDPSDLPDGPF